MSLAATHGLDRDNKDVARDYEQHRQQIISDLSERGIEDPNPHTDLDRWYAKWKDGTLPTYQSRREHVRDLYAPVVELIKQHQGPGESKEMEQKFRILLSQPQEQRDFDSWMTDAEGHLIKSPYYSST